MPMNSSTVGKSTKRFRHVAEKRWLMSYAAGIGEISANYYDVTKGLTAHPVFSVCPEWPVVLDAQRVEGSESMTTEEARSGVHASHDVLIHRPISPNESLYTCATITSVEQRKAGAFQMMRLETRDEESNLIVSTHQGGLSRGVNVVGGDKTIESAPLLPEIPSGGQAGRQFTIPVSAYAAHVYTECARIYNPIHTDRDVARAAGLPDIILHGTATLALAISCLVNNLLDGNAHRVKRYACRFSAMVLMPSTITLEVNGLADSHVWFTAYNMAGEPAIRGGYMEVR